MNNLPRKILCEIIHQNGKTFFKDTVALRGLLDDLCHGNYKKERRCIIDSIAEGIPSALLDRKESIPYDILSAQLTNRLINCGFDAQLARWTVESWALALGVIGAPIDVGSLSVVANPSEAKIFLNEKLMGLSPLEISALSAGKYDLKITLDSYETWQKRIEIPAGQKISINANLMKPPTQGEIFIDSVPEAAVIFIDSQHHGATPKTIRNIPVGVHQISLTLSGYEKFSKNVTIQPGKNVDLKEKLRSIESPPTGQIAIDSVPSNADIYLDSVYQGKTPHILTGISPGTHSIKIRLHGNPDFSTKTIIHQGTNTDIFWEFPRPPHKPIPKSIAYASIALISIVALYFVIGPLLAPFLGLIASPLKINNSPATVVTAGIIQTLEPTGTFLPDGGVLTGSVNGDVTNTYYFDVDSANAKKIRFIRISLEGDKFTDYDFIIGKDYVPTFRPPHYDVISDTTLLSEGYDIQNPTSGRYYVVVKNKGSSGGYTISKAIFYNS
ncbi:MAG: PEGA domain-containing protein [Methanoregula sp.]|jgi:hypothetical protein|uniref:PEGA domain-containing protein n=1 Tax=Methanoregula sp. TaxID=2052170 RepID=UPI003D13C8BA